jgi:nucleotide-binding universal stress UspA family protein
MFKHILIATDGSDVSSKGLTTGVALAKLSQARITILTVSEPFPAYDVVSRLSLFQDPAAVEAYDLSCQQWAENVLALASAVADAEGVRSETLHIPNSSPAAAILDTAKFRSCDLIVVASHGLHGLERFVIGSQAARVVQGADISVLVVR